MKISTIEEYGLRCLIQLAKTGTGTLSISDMAKTEGLSEAYVGKLLFLLKKKGLVKSLRGMNGGYLLAKSPPEITMADVLDCLAPGPKTDEAICNKFPGDKKECVHLHGSCGVRTVWHVVYKNLWNILNQTTLEDLLRSEKDLTAKLNKLSMVSAPTEFVPVTFKTEANVKHVIA